MLGHPGGQEHSRYLIELSFLPPPAKWLDMGAGDGSTVRLLKSLGYEAEGIDFEPVVLAVVDDLSDAVDEVVLLVFADDVFGAVVLLFVVDDLTLAVDLAVVFALDDVADELVLF